MSLTAANLFQPAPSGVGAYGNVPMVPASGTWLAVMLTIAAQVQLPTTSWQSGAPERTLFAVEAVSFSLSDADISVMAQGGFLQTAASGTVTYTTVDGTTVTIPVTPDPSNPAQNPTGAPGWLDQLGQNVYATTRLAASYATGPLAIANTTPNTLGPYAVGAYHVASTTGPTYHNQASLSIPSSVIAGTGGTIVGIAPGLQSTVITTQSAHGLAVGNSVYLSVPSTSGISGLLGVFALVTAVTPTTFSVALGSSGTYVSGGTVYLCTVATMVADVAGIGSNAGPGQVATAVTQNAGVYVSNVTSWTGSNWESNAHYVSRCQLSLAARSPNGPYQAYEYYAESAQQILSTGVLPSGGSYPTYTLTNGPVLATAFSAPGTGAVNTVVASASPLSSVYGAAVTPGVAQDPVTGVSNANPCVVSVANATGLTAGQSMTVVISGVLGTSGVNGTFLGTYVSANSFSIPVNTIGAGTYTGGGQVEGGDLGQIDELLQLNVVPDGQAAFTTSAVALPIVVTAVVVVPQAYVAAYQLAVVTQLQTQLATYAIGGNADTSPANSVPWDDILAALEEAGVIALGAASYVKAVQSLSISDTVHAAVTSSGGGIAFPSPIYQAILSTPSITVLGV
jgi:hypothetical protein